jgi:hypothetical protein
MGFGWFWQWTNPQSNEFFELHLLLEFGVVHGSFIATLDFRIRNLCTGGSTTPYYVPVA